MNRIIISAPFGNYVNIAGATSTLGTYSVDRKMGLLLQAIKTLRYKRKYSGWVNRIGLRNRGLRPLLFKHWDLNERAEIFGSKILSIYGASMIEWSQLCTLAGDLPCMLELNFSCPNIEEQGNLDYYQILRHFSKDRLIVKIPPVDNKGLINLCIDYGVWGIHACNTLHVPEGGMSGILLRPYVKAAVRSIRKESSSVEIIAGGGTYTTEDIDEYHTCGATRFAIGSMLFNPLNWLKLKSLVAHANRLN